MIFYARSWATLGGGLMNSAGCDAETRGYIPRFGASTRVLRSVALILVITLGGMACATGPVTSHPSQAKEPNTTFKAGEPQQRVHAVSRGGRRCQVGRSLCNGSRRCTDVAQTAREGPGNTGTHQHGE